jgi:hypothetical protein
MPSSACHEELARERQALLDKKQNLEELGPSLAGAGQHRGDGPAAWRADQGASDERQIEIARETSRCRTERSKRRSAEVELPSCTGIASSKSTSSERSSIKRAERPSRRMRRKLCSRPTRTIGGASLSRLNEVETPFLPSKRRAKAGFKVQPVLYRRYELIRKRRGSAIAFTHEGTCSACHMTLPPQLFQQLMRREEFGQCPSCNRILYFRVEQPPLDARAGESAETPSSA